MDVTKPCWSKYDWQRSHNSRKKIDKQINCAQVLLKNQFDKLEGLCSALVLSKLMAPLLRWESVQINSQGNHWIAALAIGCSTGQNTKSCVWLPLLLNWSCLILQSIRKQCEGKTQSRRQQGGIDYCGVFAIAVCTSLAYGHNPNSVSFITAQWESVWSLVLKILSYSFSIFVITPHTSH